jgi:hypothetical protein
MKIDRILSLTRGSNVDSMTGNTSGVFVRSSQTPMMQEMHVCMKKMLNMGKKVFAAQKLGAQTDMQSIALSSSSLANDASTRRPHKGTRP